MQNRQSQKVKIHEKLLIELKLQPKTTISYCIVELATLTSHFSQHHLCIKNELSMTKVKFFSENTYDQNIS